MPIKYTNNEIEESIKIQGSHEELKEVDYNFI